MCLSHIKTATQVNGSIPVFQTYHGTKWDGSGGVVVDGNEVNEEGCPANHSWDHKCPDEHLLDPSSAWIFQTAQSLAWCKSFSEPDNSLCPWKTNVVHWHSFITSLLSIQAPPKIAVDWGGGSVHKNGCAQHWSSPAEKTMWVEGCEISGCVALFPLFFHTEVQYCTAFVWKFISLKMPFIGSWKSTNNCDYKSISFFFCPTTTYLLCSVLYICANKWNMYVACLKNSWLFKKQQTSESPWKNSVFNNYVCQHFNFLFFL